MKRIYGLVFFVCVMFVMTGCTATKSYQPPEGCLKDDGTQKESLILEYIDHPDETAMFLKLATTSIASEISAEHVQEMIDVLKTADSMLENTSYSELANYLMNNITELKSKYSTQLMIVTQYAQNMSNINLPIYECDRVLLKKHLNEQIVLLKGMMVE